MARKQFTCSVCGGVRANRYAKTCRSCQYKIRSCEKCDTKIAANSKSGLCKKHYLEKYYSDPKNVERKNKQTREWQAANKARVSQKSLEWARANPERAKEIRKKTSSGPNNRFTRARYIAESRRGLDWEISKSKFNQLVKEPCHYCHEPIQATGVGLDRIDNSKGYTLDNVLPCCGDCNKTRGDRLTVEEMEAAMHAVIAVRKRRKLELVRANG